MSFIDINSANIASNAQRCKGAAEDITISGINAECTDTTLATAERFNQLINEVTQIMIDYKGLVSRDMNDLLDVAAGFEEVEQNIANSILDITD